MATVTFNPYQPSRGETCGICFGEMEWEQVAHECERINPAAQRVFHKYHRDCLEQSLRANGRNCPECRAPIADQNRIQILTTEQESPVRRFMKRVGWKMMLVPILPSIAGNAAAYLSLQMGADYRQAAGYYYEAWCATMTVAFIDLCRHVINKDYM
jgi:hypothetical protein